MLPCLSVSGSIDPKRQKNHTGALGEEAINIDGSIRRVATAAERRVRVRKNIPLPILLDETDGLPAREADNGTVREVANENAFDATTCYLMIFHKQGSRVIYLL
jgi:hypothetical protein